MLFNAENVLIINFIVVKIFNVAVGNKRLQLKKQHNA